MGRTQKSTLVKYTREELTHVPDETDLVWGILCHLHNDGYVRHTPRIGWEITEEGRPDENTND